jgi:hypothetical protein
MCFAVYHKGRDERGATGFHLAAILEKGLKLKAFELTGERVISPLTQALSFLL